MTLLFVILIILACVVLGLIVLIQNPKGGGLAGSLGGLNTQFMGVKQTNDALEKGTWIFIGVVAVLCILSPVFLKSRAGGSNAFDQIAPSTEQQQNQTSPANTAPFQQVPTPNSSQPAPIN